MGKSRAPGANDQRTRSSQDTQQHSLTVSPARYSTSAVGNLRRGMRTFPHEDRVNLGNRRDPAASSLARRMRWATNADCEGTYMGREPFGATRWMQLIQAEYREEPGLNLTKPQMRRLWGLDESVCDALVDALVASRVLRPSVRDTYVLVAGGE